MIIRIIENSWERKGQSNMRSFVTSIGHGQTCVHEVHFLKPCSGRPFMNHSQYIVVMSIGTGAVKVCGAVQCVCGVLCQALFRTETLIPPAAAETAGCWQQIAEFLLGTAWSKGSCSPQCYHPFLDACCLQWLGKMGVEKPSLLPWIQRKCSIIQALELLLGLLESWLKCRYCSPSLSAQFCFPHSLTSAVSKRTSQ